MSYLVLARKYRPKTFSQMVGQPHVVQALGNALSQQRLHHAYLFTGTRGVGKTTVSRILAKSLNCQGPDGQGGITAEPCGVCAACTDIDAGRFVDYTELDAASNRGIDEVRQLIEEAVYKPVQGRFKVFMIDEVHMLTGPAFNAMLKTLEEPPEYLKFVLATTDPQKVPVTVLSRCLQFNLRPMAAETIASHLAQVLAAEQVQSDPAALHLLGRAARGSMRDALSLTDQAIAFGSGRLEAEAVRQMLGSVDRAHVFELIEALAAADGARVVSLCDAIRTQGLSAASTLEEMTVVLQRMAVCQLADATADADPDAAAIARLAALMPADETQLLYSMCLQGRNELVWSTDEHAGMTMALLRLLAFKQTTGETGAQKKSLKLADPPAVPPTAPSVSTAPAEPTAVAPAAPPVVASAATALAEPVGAQPLHQPSAPSAAPGRVLPVVDAPPRRIAVPEASAQQAASPVVPIAVRQAPSTRDAVRPVSLPELTPTEEGDFWFDTVQRLVATDAIHALARELALQSQLVGRDDSQWLLRVERESLTQPSLRERLQGALASQGHAVALALEIGAVSDSPSRRIARAQAAQQQAAEQIILEDPFVQRMMRDFGAKIVPGSIRPVSPPTTKPQD